MHRPRLHLAIALLAIALSGMPGRGIAAGYPERDITFIIPNQVGGGFDAYVRAIAPAMEKYLPNKVNVVPLNVPAGGGAKGVSQLYRARPDGYTVGILNIPGLFILQARGGGYDLNKFTWLAGLGRDPYALAVPWNSPIKSVADLQALSATRPVKFTTTGPDGTAYGVTMIATELLGIRLQLITGYKGSSEYVAAAVRGDGDAVITNLPILARFEAGQSLRLLATFTKDGTRPDVPNATALGQPQLADITGGAHGRGTAEPAGRRQEDPGRGHRQGGQRSRRHRLVGEGRHGPRAPVARRSRRRRACPGQFFRQVAQISGAELSGLAIKATARLPDQEARCA